MNKQVKKYILNISILLLISGLAVFFVLKDDAKAIIQAIGGSNPLYLFICILLSVLYYVFDTLALVILTRLYKRDYKFYKGFLNDMIGKFFSGITPSSSGGQFAQAYTFNKQGISLANSASILVMAFIVFMISLIVFGSGTLIYGVLTDSLPAGYIDLFGIKLNIIAFSFIGFGINLFLVGFITILSFNRRFHHRAVNLGVKLGVFFHIIKKENAHDKKVELNAKVETFRIEIKRLFSNVKTLFLVLLVFIGRAFIAHSIPYFSILAVNGNIVPDQYFESVALSSFTYMITQIIPIPGASGGAEYVFAKMFSDIVTDQVTLNATILIWRFASFYFGLILGGIIFICYHESPKMETLHYSSRTLLEIEVIHLNEEIKPAEKKNDEVQEIEINDVAAYFEKIKEELEENLEDNEKALLKEEKRKRRINGK